MSNFHVDTFRINFRSAVYIKWCNASITGPNKAKWLNLLNYTDGPLNSNIDLYNYYNFPIGEHNKPSGTAAFFAQHFDPFLNAVDIYEKNHENYLKSFFFLRECKK